MKHTILSSLLCLSLLAASCTGWDDHYADHPLTIDNDEVAVVDGKAAAWLESQPEYSFVTGLLREDSIFRQMEAKGLFYTLFVTPDNKAGQLEDEKSYVAQSHVMTAAVSPSALTDGQRLLMWNGRYIDVTKQIVSNGTLITIAGRTVTRVIKTDDAYIYELDGLVTIPRSLVEIVANLDDSYSIIKHKLDSLAERTFEKSSSAVLGVDESGNSVYDSVFSIRYPFYESYGVDLNSTSSRYTFFIPSDEVYLEAWNTAWETLRSWDDEMAKGCKHYANYYSSRDSSILENWMLQSIIFKTEYSAEELSSGELVDLTSAASKQWRLTVNQIDTDHPIKMSNGTAYYVKTMKIPQNVLIYRIKEPVYKYNYLSATDKAAYYITDNMVFNRVQTEVSAWTPGSGWPLHENTAVWFVPSNTEFPCSLTHIGYWINIHSDNTYELVPFKVPEGEYTFHLPMGGFGYGGNPRGPWHIYLNDKLIAKYETSEITGFSRDRGGGGSPEGYTLSETTYDRDGKQVSTDPVTLVSTDGTGMVPVKIKWYCPGNPVRICPMYWTLRPTTNCY